MPEFATRALAMPRVDAAAIRLGLRENLGAFSLLMLINVFVGAMVGMERTVLPLLAEREFGVASRATILGFLAAFGAVKAIANVFAGPMADRFGRRRVLLLGWIAGIPVPFMILFAPSWDWIVAANLLLGINQGLCWSAAVVMKIDLVGPRQRGLAIGLNESAGYLAVSLAALASGFLAAEYGLRPVPFLIGVAAALGGLVASLFARETRPFAELEARSMRRQVEASGAAPATTPGHAPGSPAAGISGFEPRPPSARDVFRRVSWSDRSLRAVSQAGLVNNLNDGAGWGLFPIFFAAMGAGLREIAILVAIYPAVWGLGQVASGRLSDFCCRRWLISGGMTIQGLALLGIAAGTQFGTWLAGMVALGLGTALVYPTLLGAVADHSEPAWRATAIGVYRLWRDLGYVAGAVLAGLIADRIGIAGSIGFIGMLTIASGVVVAVLYSRPDTAALRGAQAAGDFPGGTS